MIPTPVLSCEGTSKGATPDACEEVYDEDTARGVRSGCPMQGNTLANAPCRRSGALAFCREPDQSVTLGVSRYAYDPASLSAAKGACTTFLHGVWCPLQ